MYIFYKGLNDKITILREETVSVQWVEFDWHLDVKISEDIIS